MKTHRNIVTTAILPMAVVFLAAVLSGCATSRHVRDIRADIQRVEQQGLVTQQKVARLDSLYAARATEDSRMRAEMATTIKDLQDLVQQLLQSNSDLMTRVDQLAVQTPRVYQRDLQSSPGAQSSQQPTVGAPGATTEPGVDCSNSYDEAFLQVRRGEYEAAIAGFRAFIEKCPRHESVSNAYYWIGESYYSMEKYADAIKEFEHLIKEYQSSPNLCRALYKMGRSYQEMGRKDKATEAFKRVVDECPETLEQEQAKEQLKVLK